MALLLKCDRCRKSYEPYKLDTFTLKNGTKIFSANTIVLLGYSDSITKKMVAERNEMDLCPECMNAFKDFFNAAECI